MIKNSLLTLMCLDEILLNKNLQQNFVLSFYQLPQVLYKQIYKYYVCYRL